jgi:hypothetical protein
VIFPRAWASLRLLGVAPAARDQGAAPIGLHTGEAMTTASASAWVL